MPQLFFAHGPPTQIYQPPVYPLVCKILVNAPQTDEHILSSTKGSASSKLHVYVIVASGHAEHGKSQTSL